MEKCSWILVDVAGTTTSINFVKDTLYPLVTKQAADFLKSKWEVDEIKELVKKLKDNEELNVDAAAELIKTLTQENSENESLKTIQGLIYKHYYENGELKGHVFDDVPEAFEQWAKLKQLAIYSSGSIESQKLLYTHSLHGDLSGHILKYFDQSVGSKTEKESYEKIAKTLEVKPEEILFITDCTKEGKAAKSAGVNVNIITREGNSDIPEEEAKEFQVIASFKEVLLENPSKRKNDEEASAEEPPSKVTKTEGTPEGKPEEKTESMQVDNTATNNTQETAVETVKETEITADDKTDVAMNEVKPTEESGKEAETENAEKKSAVDVVEDEKSETSEKKEEKTNPDMVAEKVTESPVEPEKNDSEGKTEGASKEVENTSETDKDESKEAKTDVQSEESVQTSDKPAEVVEPEEATTETKTEEKENKSDLANGVENGKKEEAEETDVAETKEEETEVKSDEVEIKKEETEVKLKKLEETTESKTVTVEV